MIRNFLTCQLAIVVITMIGSSCSRSLVQKSSSVNVMVASFCSYTSKFHFCFYIWVVFPNKSFSSNVHDTFDITRILLGFLPMSLLTLRHYDMALLLTFYNWPSKTLRKPLSQPPRPQPHLAWQLRPTIWRDIW